MQIGSPFFAALCHLCVDCCCRCCALRLRSIYSLATLNKIHSRTERLLCEAQIAIKIRTISSDLHVLLKFRRYNMQCDGRFLFVCRLIVYCALFEKRKNHFHIIKFTWASKRVHLFRYWHVRSIYKHLYCFQLSQSHCQISIQMC